MNGKKTATTLKQKISLIIISIIFSLILSELCLQLIGLIYNISYKRNNNNVINDGEYRVLCLGESTTAPTSPVNDVSYPVQLQKLLDGQDNTEVKYRIINEGICGASTGDALARLNNQLEKYRPHLVILMVGTNDNGLTVNFSNNIVTRTGGFLQGLRLYKLLIAGPIKLYKAKKSNNSGEFENNSGNKKDFIEDENVGSEDDDENSNDERIFTVYDGYVSFFEWLSEHDHELYLTVLKKFLSENPASDVDFYLMLADEYKKNENYEKAEEVIKKALALFDKSNHKYNKLYTAIVDVYDYFIVNNSKYKDRCRASDYIYYQERLLDEFTDDADIFYGYCSKILGYYGNRNFPDKSTINLYIKEKLMNIIMTAFRLADDDKKYKVVFLIGKYYYLMNDFINAEKYLNLAAEEEINSKELSGDARIISDDLAVSYLLEIYRNDFQKKEELLLKIAKKSNNLPAYKILYLLYSNNNETAKAKAVMKKITKIEAGKIIPSYYSNYREICKRIIDKKIKIISMSYPNRNTDSLEKMLFDMKKEIIFVSNDKPFKKALQEKGIDEVFADLFGGDFGHCTEYGYSLIANNLLPVILKESK